jgi:hypothetical protein
MISKLSNIDSWENVLTNQRVKGKNANTKDVNNDIFLSLNIKYAIL